ncbi:MAG: dissimilatory-type sulfite reductase subunit alpha [Deltaproteobacteria bacterium]|nr:dissimilatory-type sulfite reductase subunit alpha [Deltaproteobacteria bacterium]MBW2085100.1 dissimilatory-type sulfite reductase subunit alpha [Deltaproteobacteria bacterium]
MPITHKTPLLDELEKGPWPSFVKDIKRAADEGGSPTANDLLGQLELSYEQKIGHWKHGGIVGVFGYGGGVIGRYSDVPHLFPSVTHFHTLRINQPASKFYSSEQLRTLADIWDKHGSMITNMHGSTGDIIFLGCRTEALEPCFADLTANGFDLGGSGSALRTPSCCVGRARCEWSCLDTQDITYNLTMTYQDEMHRPAWPYKFKFKTSGCPNDCVAAIARADCSIIGTWRDEIRINQKEVQNYADAGLDIQKYVIDLCPAECMSYQDGEIQINNKKCTRCMHCINVMTKALRPGTDVGATILIGAKAPILEGAQMSAVVMPFLKMEKVSDDLDDNYTELKDFIDKLWEWWDENGKNRERVGELIQRLGYRAFLDAVEIDPIPQMIKEPRSNPYIFFLEQDVEGGWERDLEEYRARHQA